MRRVDETRKQRVRLIRSALEFGMKLHSDEERMIFNLYRFDESAVRRSTPEDKPAGSQGFSVIVVEFVTVTVSFAYLVCLITVVQFRTASDFAGIAAES